MTASRRLLGAQGEDRVAAWYVGLGFELLDRNWRTRQGEIDLIVQRDALVAFCEVKTRTTAAFGSGLEAVTWTKQQRIRHLATDWLQSHPSPVSRRVRFDVASIVAGVLEVVEDAF